MEKNEMTEKEGRARARMQELAWPGAGTCVHCSQ